MPTYDFKCPKGHVTEQHHSFSTVPQTITCKCKEEAERQIGAGGGFVINKIMRSPSKRIKNYDLGV